jgi:hypothetical protein
MRQRMKARQGKANRERELEAMRIRGVEEEVDNTTVADGFADIVVSRFSSAQLRSHPAQ